MATLLPMALKVRLVKHHHLGNLNRDTRGASLVPPLRTRLSLGMGFHQPHNLVMGLHLEAHTLVMGHLRARKHHQIHQHMLSLSNHRLR